jgi:hypothetical protein
MAAWDAAGAAAWDAARAAARAGAGAGAGAAAGDAAWDAAGDAAGASYEIIGRLRMKSFYFLPFFGFASPDEIPLHPDVTSAGR